MAQIYSRFGTIFKREALLTTASDHAAKALILEAKDPFPGYYCSEESPADSSCKLQSYYLPIYSGSLPSEDQLCRLSLEVRCKFEILCCPARFSLNGKTVKGLRFRSIDPGMFEEVVSFFETAGITFYAVKKTGTFLSHIYLKAFFNVRKISDNVYQNADNHDLNYLLVNESVDWNIFEKLFTFQKSKAAFRNYDAAMGYWYTQPVFTDFIRIYGKGLDTDSLHKIREDFLHNLEGYKESKILI